MAKQADKYTDKSGLKIMLLTAPGVSETGVTWYRLRQVLKGLERYTEASTIEVLNPSMVPDQELRMMFGLADFVITTTAYKPVFMDIKRFSEGNARVILDQDDNTDFIAPENEHYEEMGTKNIKINNKAVWVTGETKGFDAFVNRDKQLKRHEAIYWADAVSVTTPHLAKYIETLDPQRVIVVPNSIDFDDLYFPNAEVKDTSKHNFRVAWHGGVSHHGDFQEIGPALGKYLNKTTGVEFYSIGTFFPDLFGDVHKGRIKSFGWTSFQSHPMRLKLLDIDAALIPLELDEFVSTPGQFNSYKSCIKWYEFSALKIPCVVANRMPYSTEIENGVTGLLYDTPKEAIEQLERLRKDSKFAKKVAKNAYDWVYENRSLKEISKQTYKLYEQINK
jgi:hypothetical protein